MRELVFISAQPDDLNYAWQVEVQINNFRKFGYSDKMQVLLYLPLDRSYQGWNPVWKEMEGKYPEVQFFRYEDLGIFSAAQYIYKSVIRPHILEQHFRKYPQLITKAIFYHDCDIVFTQKIDFDPFLEDDICYGSQTDSYISAEYFDSKVKDVLPEKLEAFKKIDVLQGTTALVGINRSIVEFNDRGSIGAQYLLKNIDADYWKDVEDHCLKICLYLAQINNKYFEDQNKGYQKFCADMWAVLWNLWKRGMVTEVHEEFDFAWATDKIEKWDKTKIYHNAGVTGMYKFDEDEVRHVVFDKTKSEYVNNEGTPFDDSELLYLFDVSDYYCSYKYTREIISTKVARAFHEFQSSFLKQQNPKKNE